VAGAGGSGGGGSKGSDSGGFSIESISAYRADRISYGFIIKNKYQ